MSTSFGKDPQNPRHGGETNIGGGTGGSGVRWGGGGGAIKHLSDPHNPRDGGDGEGGKWPTIIKAEKQIDISDGSTWFKPVTGDGIILKVGGDHDISDGSGWVIEDPTETINGDDQYDARTKEWLGGEGLDHEWYIRAAGQDRIGSTEYGGRTSEDISDGTGFGIADGDFYINQEDWFGPVVPGPGYIEGDYGFSGDWGFSGVWDKQDTTGLSGHTNSFSGDWGL